MGENWNLPFMNARHLTKCITSGYQQLLLFKVLTTAELSHRTGMVRPGHSLPHMAAAESIRAIVAGTRINRKTCRTPTSLTRPTLGTYLTADGKWDGPSTRRSTLLRTGTTTPGLTWPRSSSADGDEDALQAWTGRLADGGRTGLVSPPCKHGTDSR